MPDRSVDTQSVAPAAIEAALSSLCCRFGEPEQEAHRRGRVRALIHSSRALALALDHFVQHAGPRARGEHCTSDMQPDVDALVQALSDWSFSVNASADVHRECCESRVARDDVRQQVAQPAVSA